MFSIRKNVAYTVNKAVSGTKKDGSKFALIKLIESENQPEGIERPSKSSYPVNMWLEEFPAAVKDLKNGDKIIIVNFEGFDVVHQEFFRRDGSKDYADAIQLVDFEVKKA